MSRSLAHIEKVEWVKEIPAADSIELVGILGWQCIQKIGETKVGDKVVYIEIDSLVNKEDERFAFLEPKHYKVKTMRLGKKLGQPFSQGLAMPLSLFPELGDPEIGTDVTEQLKITYYNVEDRKRKSTKTNPDVKYNRMVARLYAHHPKIASLKITQYLIRRSWGKKILFVFFGKKADTPKGFPGWIVKTDETRIENAPFYLEDKEPHYSVTEKCDGTSVTIAVDRLKHGKNKFDFIVCSRNVRQINEDEIPFDGFATNVYLEMAKKYDFENILTDFAIKNGYNRVVVQGECIGETIQKNPYKLKGRELRVFNLVIEGQRVTSDEMMEWCKERNIPTVPLIYENHELPHTMEEMKAEAEGMSVINPNTKREGLVYRRMDDSTISFKNVANSYLLKAE